MTTLSTEVESPISPVRMFRAALLDWYNLGPKIVPEIIASGSTVEGDGGVGTISQINFTSVMPFSYVKERLDFVDHDNYECRTSILEGGHLGVKLESASAHYKIVPAGNGGCICKMSATYKLLPGVSENGDDAAKVTESTKAQLKAVEAYLLANPSAYA